MGEATISSRARLGRSQSLKSRAKISELFKKAKKRSGSYLTVFYSLGPCATGESPSGTGKAVGGKEIGANAGLQILIAVPKRTGNAVLRNKVRRRLREEFRLWDKRGGLAGELIVRYNPPKKSEPRKYDRAFFAELRGELAGLLEYVYNKTVNTNR
jgi:ribonuclease P protein component